MQILNTILLILLFIFCLSILIIVHEVGHFLTAKYFKVYIKEFSIGFGPALLHKKRKNGETYFSIRAVPLGGYVAMYGEGEALDPSLGIDESRSYEKLKRWKKIVILFAGVFNNAVLALILFFISESCFPQQGMYLSYVDVAPSSIAEKANIKKEDYVAVRQAYYLDKDNKPVASKGNYTLDVGASISFKDGGTKKVAAVLTTMGATYNYRSYDGLLRYFAVDYDGYVDFGTEYKASDATVRQADFTVTTATSWHKQYIGTEWVRLSTTKPSNPAVKQAYYQEEEIEGKIRKVIYKWDGNNWVPAVNSDVVASGYVTPTDVDQYAIWKDIEADKTLHPITLNEKMVEEKHTLESSGLSFLYEEWWNTPGEMFAKPWTDFGNASGLIVKTIGSLFYSAETWKDIGGIVAIGVQTSNVLTNMGLGRFIYIWAVISVNLAIVNLFPFPGLDGWQILVLAVEGIFHKQIPDKVKHALSLIGMALLFAFMIIILVKDVIGLF